MGKLAPILDNLESILEYQKTKKGGGGGDTSSATGWDWGFRTDPISGAKNAWHNGVDLPDVSGTKLYALMDGKIKKVWKDDLNGNGLQISHSDPDYPEVAITGYAHLSAYADIEVGQEVKAGDLVAYMGSTGASTGPHVHFVVFGHDPQYVEGANRADLDPLPYLEEAVAQKKSRGTAQGLGLVLGGLGVVGVLYWVLSKNR